MHTEHCSDVLNLIAWKAVGTSTSVRRGFGGSFIENQRGWDDA
jgi:hypothetical protein